ncbi:hypothetical protein CLAIMM_14823 [Cladophialophora immunda]|nr:hypothetical protein CLAIMM_14823 [Cladophialophora immunda]
MFEHEESHGKYAVVSEAAWSPPPKRQARPPKYYAPFSTRWPALTLILLVMLACIAVLEYGLRSGLTLEEKNQQQNHSRLKRQDPGVSSSTADTATTSATSTTLIEASTVDSIEYVSQTESPTTAAADSTPSPTDSTSTPESIDPATTAGSDITSTTGSSTLPPASTSTTAYIDPITTPSSTSDGYITQITTSSLASDGYITQITSQSVTTDGETMSMTTTSSTGAYIATTVTTSRSSSTTIMSTTTMTTSGTAPYIVPSATEPGTSATPVITSSTTPYILQVTSSTTAYVVQSTSTGKGKTSTTPYNAHTETTTAYVQQSTSTKPTNPYTVPSSSATSRARTTTSIALTSSSNGQTHSRGTTVLGEALTSGISTSIYTPSSPASTSEAESSPSRMTYGEGYTASISTPSAKLSSSQFTALITYTTEDALGRPLTTVATETYAVVVTTEISYDSTGSVSTIIATLTSYSSTITPTVLAESTSIPTTPPDHQRADEVELGLAVSDLQYFRAIYLPVLIAVILKLVWATVFASTKMMEPFYLLSREKGASAADSLLADYMATSLSIEGLSNMFLSHPVVTLVGLVYLCLSALPSIATQCTTVRAIAWCRSPDLIMERCNPMWYLKIDYARALQAILSLIAVIILLVIILSSRRRSGVFSNPSSVATMASLLNNEELMEDLRRIDQRSSRSSAKQLLDPYRYMLRRHQTTTGYMRYGVVRAPAQAAKPAVNYTKQPKYSALAHSHTGGGNMHNSRSTLSNRFLIDTLFLLSILALLGVLVGYYMDGQDDPFNNYFNRNPTRQFVLTVAASLLDIRWKQLEREVRLLTPYRRLFRGSAKPDSTILVSQNSTPLTSIFQALWRGNFFHAFVAFVAILSDVLIIAIGGVPFNSAQIWLDFLVSIYASWAILA